MIFVILSRSITHLFLQTLISVLMFSCHQGLSKEVNDSHCLLEACNLVIGRILIAQADQMASQGFTVGNSSVSQGNKGPCKVWPCNKSQSLCQVMRLHLGFLVVNVSLIFGPLQTESQVQRCLLAGDVVERLHSQCICLKAAEAMFALDF